MMEKANGKKKIRTKLFDIFADYPKEGNKRPLLELIEEFYSLYDKIGKKAVNSLLSIIQQIYSFDKHYALEIALEVKPLTDKLIESNLSKEDITDIYEKIEKIPLPRLKGTMLKRLVSLPYVIELKEDAWRNWMDSLYEKIQEIVKEIEEETIKIVQEEYKYAWKDIH